MICAWTPRDKVSWYQIRLVYKEDTKNKTPTILSKCQNVEGVYLHKIESIWSFKRIQLWYR